MTAIALRDRFIPTKNIFDSIFDDPFFGGPFREMHAWRDQRNYVTHREEDGLHIDIAMPGVSKGNVDVRVEDGVLRVSRSVKEGDDNRFTALQQDYAWRLSDDLEPSGITAKMEDGVLELVIPHREKEVHTIDVR